MLIGIMGKGRAGKDTLAGLLGTLGFERVAFADALYDEVAELSGLPENELRENKDSLDYSKEEWLGGGSRDCLARNIGVAVDEVPLSVRRSLQWYGKFRRDEDERYWVRRAAPYFEGKRHACVSDIRYPNEALYIKQSGGILVRVLRPDMPQSLALTGEAAQDSSETALDNYPADATLINNEGRSQEMLQQLVFSPECYFARFEKHTMAEI